MQESDDTTLNEKRKLTAYFNMPDVQGVTQCIVSGGGRRRGATKEAAKEKQKQVPPAEAEATCGGKCISLLEMRYIEDSSRVRV